MKTQTYSGALLHMNTPSSSILRGEVADTAKLLWKNKLKCAIAIGVGFGSSIAIMVIMVKLAPFVMR